METSQLICRANQLTGFYMTATLAFNELNKIIIPNLTDHIYCCVWTRFYSLKVCCSTSSLDSSASESIRNLTIHGGCLLCILLRMTNFLLLTSWRARLHKRQSEKYFKCFNPFHDTGLFRYHLNISENHRFSYVFRGYRKSVGLMIFEKMQCRQTANNITGR